MRVLLWHVHGSWTTAFVQGRHDYVLPVDPGRTPDGRGRARTWDWPASAREVPIDRLRDEPVDVVVLQRPHEAGLLERWTGLRAGRTVPAVYLEHDTPRGPAADTRHPVADRDDLVLVHVTGFNAVMWDAGSTPTRVIEHGVVDPGPLWTGERERVAAVVNEPVRRWRVAGTDLLVRIVRDVPADVYGMGVAALAGHVPPGTALREDLPQARLHQDLAGARAYLHPYRWTSLGLALVEAMTLGMPVVALAATAVPESVPDDAGVVSTDPDLLRDAARRLLADRDEARERGRAARRHALDRFSLDRFLTRWDDLFLEVT
ncbi:glycosyltransferase [Xylanimonas protaetiae]|uniref:Glycosyltransferase n=1 Tax=Xylanimonas protaetiae TaxID=2509457 RepID=A0A4V0YGG9_9MICO|nr:glycosyltransferase [Xylanimonas protaetiae]QAY71171.1 glycosyltransferase [Xylanimonas protaetiae]